jgi:hypothetical protein
METHKCNKEKEIERLTTNGGWIMDNIKSITTKIEKLDTKLDTLTQILTTGEGKIGVLNKAVFGPDGLNCQVQNIKQDINQFKGMATGIKALVVFSASNFFALVGVIIALFTYLK